MHTIPSTAFVDNNSIITLDSCIIMYSAPGKRVTVSTSNREHSVSFAIIKSPLVLFRTHRGTNLKTYIVLGRKKKKKKPKTLPEYSLIFFSNYTVVHETGNETTEC